MPKEIIHSAWTGQDDVKARVEVGWSKEAAYVQLGSLMPAGAKVPDPEGPNGNGWFADLDRPGINRLIRALRKARDQAYGADA